jgi:tetratricopeptide (TPR) repeat protein
MFLGTTVIRHFISIICLLIALLNLSACENSKPFPVLGSDPVAPLILEDHSQALAHWAEQGIHDAVLINFDAHDDIRRIPESKVSRLKDMYRSLDWEGFKEADSVADRGMYSAGSWIYAGARLGVFREVYWIVPYDLFSLQHSEHFLRQFLKSIKFSVDDIKTFRLRNNQFSGSFQGIPFTFCSPESLPSISGPLLLSIDTDFFPVYSDEYRIHYLEALHRIFTSLFSRNYRIQGAAVSISVNGEYLPPHLRWVGETAAMIIEKPEMIEEQPSVMLRLMQQLDNAYRVADASEILRHAAHYTSPFPEPSILLYKAYAHMLKGDTDRAYEAAMASCTMDRRYCAGLPYIGTLYFMKEKPVKAERFFRAGFSADPEMENGLYCLAHCLREAGNLKETVAYYKRVVELNGSFPADFLIFETCLLSGDRSKAMDALKTAVSGLGNPYAEVVDERAAKAIYSAIDYADKEGLTGLLKTLRNNPAVRNMFINYPRN